MGKRKKTKAVEALESQFIASMKTGETKASCGYVVNYSAADLKEIAENTQKTGGACVVHHPQVTSYSLADFDQVTSDKKYLKIKVKNADPEFAEAVKIGFLPTVSVRVVGTKPNRRIEHLGFLPKGVNPAMKDLPAVQFSEDEEPEYFEFETAVELDFSEVNGWRLESALRSISEIFTNMREKLIEEKGLEEANKQLPRWEIEDLKRSAEKVIKPPEPAKTAHNYEENTEEPEMNEEEKKAQAEKKKKERKDFEDQVRDEVKAKLKRSMDFNGVADAKIAERKMTPIQVKIFKAINEHLEEKDFAESVLDFSDGGETKQKSVRELMLDFMETTTEILAKSPVIPDPGKSDPNTLNYSDDGAVDKAVRAEMAKSGLSYREAHSKLKARS